MTLVVGPKSVGSPLVSERPEPFGPRKRLHSSLGPAAGIASNAMSRRRFVIMVVPWSIRGSPRVEKRGSAHVGDNQAVTDTKAESRRRRITIRRFQTAAEADASDRQFWAALPDVERVMQVWRLSKEQWALRGESVDESGLCRSV